MDIKYLLSKFEYNPFLLLIMKVRLYTYQGGHYGFRFGRKTSNYC